jgi:hypothetical protein
VEEFSQKSPAKLMDLAGNKHLNKRMKKEILCRSINQSITNLYDSWLRLGGLMK